MFFLDCLVTETAIENFLFVEIFVKYSIYFNMIENSIFGTAQRTLCAELLMLTYLLLSHRPISRP